MRAQKVTERCVMYGGYSSLSEIDKYECEPARYARVEEDGEEFKLSQRVVARWSRLMLLQIRRLSSSSCEVQTTDWLNFRLSDTSEVKINFREYFLRATSLKVGCVTAPWRAV